MGVVENCVSFTKQCKYIINAKNELVKFIQSSLDEVCLGNIDGTKVESIKEGAFKNVDFIKTVFFPPELKAIETKAFEGCKNLVSIFFNNMFAPENEELVIQTDAFRNCVKLDNIHIKTNQKVKIEGDAFNGCCNLRVMVIESPSIILSENFARNSSNLEVFVPKNTSKDTLTKLREWKIKSQTIE